MISRLQLSTAIAVVAAALCLVFAGAVRAQAQSVDYLVRPGDTLIELADQYLTSPAAYREVARLNRISNPRRLPIGRVLRIPAPLLRTIPAEGRIAQVRGAATLDQAGAERPVSVGLMVREGALISTGANTFVRLALPDGGHVVLPSHSRVRVARLRTIVLNGATDQLLRVEAGRLEAEAAPVRPAGGFSVETPISVSAVRGTQFRSTYNPGSALAGTEVIEGVVAVEVGDQEVVAREGEGVSASSDGARLASLLPAPALLDPDAIQSGETVVFRPAPVPGAIGYRARLATDAGMVDAFAETDGAADDPLAFTGVDDGLYFVRLSAISAEGLEGLAEVHSVIRARNGLAGLSTSAEGRHYLFRWEPEGEGPAQYRFQLRAEDATAPLIDEAGLAEARFTAAGLPPGRYTWRVRITRQRFGRTLETWSEPQSLRIGG